MHQTVISTQSPRLYKCFRQMLVWSKCLNMGFVIFPFYMSASAGLHNFLMLTKPNIGHWFCFSINYCFREILFLFLNSKSEDHCINQNLKKERRNMWEGEEGQVSSELRKVPQSLQAFCNDSRYGRFQVPTIGVQVKTLLLSLHITQVSWQAPETRSDTWAGIPLASHQLPNEMFSPKISPEPCLVRKWSAASNIWQQDRRIANIASWCILMSPLLIIITTYFFRFLKHGKGYTCFFFFYNFPIDNASQTS